MTTAETITACLDDESVRAEELLAATAWAIAGRMELSGPVEENLAVDLNEHDQPTRLAAMALCAWARSVGLHVTALTHGPRSWFAAALIGVDELLLDGDATSPETRWAHISRPHRGTTIADHLTAIQASAHAAAELLCDTNPENSRRERPGASP